MNKLALQLFRISFAIFVITIPWQTRWIFLYHNLGGQNWEQGKLGLYGSMIILLLTAIFFVLSHPKELHFSKDKFLYFVFLYAIVMGFLSPLPIVSFYYTLLILLAVLFAHLFRFVDKTWVLKVFLFSGVLQAILALRQLIFQYIGANKWLGIAEHLPYQLGTAVVELGDQRILRAYGSLPHPNILGGFLFVAIFCGICLWMDFYKKGDKKNWDKLYLRDNLWQFLFVVISLVICTYALLASFSRSAVLALAASLFSVLIINILRRRWMRVGVVIRYSVLFLLVILSFNIWFGGAWSARLQIKGRLEQQSIEARAGTFKQYYNSSGQEILFGQGLGMNTKVTHDHNPDEPLYNIQPIHDIFVLSLAEVGVFGVLLLLFVLRLIIKEANEIDVMSTSLILGLGVIGLFDHYLWTTWTGWLLLAFAFVNMYKSKLKDT